MNTLYIVTICVIGLAVLVFYIVLAIAIAEDH